MLDRQTKMKINQVTQKLKFIIVLFIIGQSVFAQQKLQVIKADSIAIDIRDGNNFNKAVWFISPQTKPDIYKTSNKNIHKITFYTNLDSISFIVKPNVKYNFIILLNNKDSALTQILYEPTYQETLKNAGKYNLNEKKEIPKFTYQSADNSHLVALRKAFNLDSIVGTGNEVSQILNLLHWIHNYIPHDGEHENPEIKNALSMITICHKTHQGLNCRGLATVLNECYLSMGIKSRFITCLPKDSLHIDNDCHVINSVYSTQLKKWLWIDPTFDAYVMNEKGELLSIEEVRERIINNKPLILNPEANWNRKTSQNKEYYFYTYMTKNLYLFECPISSEYDTETHQQGKVITYLRLVPLDYFAISLDKSEYTENKTKLVVYKTSNPTIFWQIP